MKTNSISRHFVLWTSLSFLAACGLTSRTSDLKSSQGISAGAHPSGAQLGQGWDKSGERFSGHCVTPTQVVLPAANAGAKIIQDKTISATQFRSQMGINAKVMASYLSGTANVNLDIAQSIAQDEYSLNYNYLGEYDLGTTSFGPSPTNFQYTNPTGATARNDMTKWIKTCGDEYVQSISYGARFVISFRFEFVSREAKEAFLTEMGGSFSGAVASGDFKMAVKNAQEHRSQKLRVTLEIFQVGGDPSKIGQAITGLTQDSHVAARQFMDCNANNLDACSDAVATALEYAAGTTGTSFGAQLADISKGQPLRFFTAPWSDLGISSAPSALVTGLDVSRQLLDSKFEKLFVPYVRIARMKSAGFRIPLQQMAVLDHWEKTLSVALTQLNGAFITCYDTISLSSSPLGKRVDDCRIAVEKIEVDKALPPPEVLIAGGRYAIDARFDDLGGEAFLGRPKLECAVDPCKPNPYRRTQPAIGLFREYEQGVIYWHPDAPETGAFAVDALDQNRLYNPGQIEKERHSILALWNSYGREKGTLGFPVSNPVQMKEAGRFIDFRNWNLDVVTYKQDENEDQKDKGVSKISPKSNPEIANGSIYWNPVTGAAAIWGDIRAYWLHLGGAKSFLGFPTSNPQIERDYEASLFGNKAAVYYSPQTGAHAIYDAVNGGHTIFSVWMQRLDGPRGPYGLPITEVTLDNGQSQQLFGSIDHGKQKLTGAIFGSNLSGTFAMDAAIYETFDRQRSREIEGSLDSLLFLGPLISNMEATSKAGFRNRFGNGAIYFNPQTYQSFSVSGPIYKKWKDGYAECSNGDHPEDCLGYPMSDILPKDYVTNKNWQFFENGMICWTNGIAYPVYNYGSFRFFDEYLRSGGPTGMLGCPTGNKFFRNPSLLLKNYYLQTFEGGLIRQDADGADLKTER